MSDALVAAYIFSKAELNKRFVDVEISKSTIAAKSVKCESVSVNKRKIMIAQTGVRNK